MYKKTAVICHQEVQFAHFFFENLVNWQFFDNDIKMKGKVKLALFPLAWLDWQWKDGWELFKTFRDHNSGKKTCIFRRLV